MTLGIVVGADTIITAETTVFDRHPPPSDTIRLVSLWTIRSVSKCNQIRSVSDSIHLDGAYRIELRARRVGASGPPPTLGRVGLA